MTEQVINFDEIFAKYMAKNQKVWEHDRSSTLGASENFDCLRLAWFEKQGAAKGFKRDEDADKSYGAMERGNLIENHYVVPGIRAGLPAGMHLELAGTQQQTLVLGRMSATPDGLITGLQPGPLTVIGGDQEIEIPDIGADCIVLEIKSIDPRAILVEERAKHHNQTQIQLGLIRELGIAQPRFSIVLYVDASFLDKFTPFVVEFDEAIYAEAKRRAADLWTVDDPMMVVPEGRFSGRCKTCPWKTACQTAIVASIPKFEETSDPVALNAISPLIAEFARAKEECERAEKAKEIAAERVKECLHDHETRKLIGDEWTISWGPVEGKLSLDTRAMEADGIDLGKYQKRGATSDRLYYTPKVKRTRKPKSK